jgi:hypothetical protein
VIDAGAARKLRVAPVSFLSCLLEGLRRPKIGYVTLEEAIAILRSPEGKDETRRVHRLHRTVEVATQVIYSQQMSRHDAERIVDEVARIAEDLFPGSRETFEIVYGYRMRRVIGEVFGLGN